jgi:hypothetical protein
VPEVVPQEVKRSEKIQASLQPLQQAMLIWSDASKTKSEAKTI